MLSFEPCWARSSFHTKTVLAADLREPKKKDSDRLIAVWRLNKLAGHPTPGVPFHSLCASAHPEFDSD
ncbi:hypothetical protein JCM14450A_28110 [Geobacillus stearothermophilus]